MGLAIDIADAVAAELNAAPADVFGEQFTAQRQVLPRYDLRDPHTGLQVVTVPKRVQITNATRADSAYLIEVDVGVQKKLGKDLDAEVGPLTSLVDEIADFVRTRKLAQTPFAKFVSIENDPVFAPDHLAEDRLFTSVLTITYQALK